MVNLTEKYYAGIGARLTPKPILNEIVSLGYGMAIRGWILRSGGAGGADSAFESGAMQATGVPEIFLPWKRFNGHLSTRYNIPDDAFDLALEYYPNPAYLKKNLAVWKLMARNCQQVLGQDLDVHSKMVLCWTPDGIEDGTKTTRHTGGTGQAIRIATAYDIPTFNLKNEDAIERMGEFIGIF
jgi:hypothetical protein